MPRPINQGARDRLLNWLARRIEPASAPEIAEALGVSAPTAVRMLNEAASDVIAAGNARRRRYHARRALRGDVAPQPVVAIDRDGRAHAAGALSLVGRESSHWLPGDPSWPIPAESVDGWWPGLPHPLVDMRPQGFMGREFARVHSGNLRLDPDPDPGNWSDDDVLTALTAIGADMSGNLIVGHRAFELWQRSTLAAPELIGPRSRGRRYAELAERALAGGSIGSSAGGEFPKFTALRERADAATPHVIVKFSRAERSEAAQRWADLLVCEHLALETVQQVLGIPASRSEILRHAGRTFLEVERFDRHGVFGRSPLVSLEVVDAAFVGGASSLWTDVARSLRGLRLLEDAAVADIDVLRWFGRLIANTDMHGGNLSFVPHDGRFVPAPVYDMLPMKYAPFTGGEVPPVDFDPPLPAPTERAAWLRAFDAALQLWRRAAGDDRIGDAFRATCAGNARLLETRRARA